MAVLTTIKRISNGPSIGLPDGRQLQIQHKGPLPLPNIVDKRAGDVNIVPQLSSASLLSVGQFTNFGCTAELSHSTAIIKKDHTPILTGYRNFRDGLWDVKQPVIPRSPQAQVANVIIKLDPSRAKLADFLHGCLCSPCPSTLMKAIKNNHFVSWPGMNEINFN